MPSQLALWFVYIKWRKEKYCYGKGYVPIYHIYNKYIFIPNIRATSS